ncbi:MAG: oligoribonuclease, partial [Betaproteobacteria bacterium]|nr:oligoribonuclease [Betaproteobacteria bacterium]
MSTVDSQGLALQPEESRALASQAAAQAAARPNVTHLIWLDMEMSGLRPEVDRILEVAVIITDTDLNPLAESEAIAIRQ